MPDPTPAATRLVDALIFRAGSTPIDRATLLRAIGPDIDLDSILDELREQQAGRGFELVSVGQGWRYQTCVDLGPDIAEAAGLDEPRLPAAALEALAVIASHQPVTRAEVEAFRGRALPAPTLDLLIERKLIRPVGRSDGPGRPRLWGTGPEFASTFGIEAIADILR